MAPLVKRYDSMVANRGDTIHIPNISNLSANTKTQGSEVTTQAVTETETQISINTWKETSFEIEDIVKIQSNYDLRSEYTSKAGYKTFVALGRNPYRKFRKFGGTPCDMDNTEPSPLREGVETRDGTSFGMMI